jgi:hypothetical protein
MSTTSMSEIRDFKRTMVILTDTKVLPYPYVRRLRIIREFLRVAESCVRFTPKGFKRDWMVLKDIVEKMANNGCTTARGEVSNAIIDILPEVTGKNEIKGRISNHAKNKLFIPGRGYFSTYRGFIQRRGNGEKHIFVRPRWIPIWKNIYFPTLKD